MAGELHKLTVRFDADVSAFNAALQSSEQRVKTFTTNATKSISDQSKAEAELARHHERIIQLENQWQVAQQKRNAAAAQMKNSEVINQFQKVNTVTSASTRTTLSSASAFRQLSSNMTTVAATMLPVNAGLLRVGSTLGMLTLSGGVMVGALAGLLALSKAWDAVAGSAKKAAEESEKSAKRVEALMEKLRSTELANVARDIVEQEAKKADLVRKLGNEDDARRDAIRLGLPTPGIFDRQKRLNEIEEVRIALAALYNEEQRLVGSKITENAEAHAAAEKKRAAALKATEKDLNAHISALTALVESGNASVAQTVELRAAQEEFAATLRSGTASAVDQAAALQNLTRIQKAFTEERLRALRADQAATGAGRLADIGPVGSRRDPVFGTGGDLLRAPRTISFLTAPQVQPQEPGGGFLAGIGTHLAGTLSAMPQAMITGLVTGVVTSLAGKLFSGIGGLFGGGGESKAEEAARLQLEAANRQVKAAQEMLKATYQIQNVPINFNAAGARARIGAGLASGGGLTVNGGIRVNVDSSTTWEGFKRQINVAADSGDVFARALSLSAR